MSDLLDAARRSDTEAFDRAVEAIGGARPMLDALLEEAPADVRARARACLPARAWSPHALPRLDVAALARIGPVGLWEATLWALDAIPVHARTAPSPPHEQWDALLEIFRARIEAPWLPIELLASLGEGQRPLARRIVLGLSRRFGSRAGSVAAARLRLGPAPLADVLEQLAASNS